ncbi:MAG: Na+/H+ antiporter NhaC [Opitutaceae bacterium]|jgi:Na+:H+ antiporter, NhaC family|nr:Na+/H+ antiporter NhaC [Opitutaceae bacterium]
MSLPPPTPRQPTLIEALIPVGALVVFLAGAVLNLNDLPTLAVITPLLSALASVPLLGSVLGVSIPVQIPLIAATVVAGLMAWRLGAGWSEIQRGMTGGIMHALGSILILLMVGILIGVWIASGVVPMMIVWGLKLMSPEYFLVAACLICAVVSLVTGSSWTTAGTVGVALIGVAQGLGVSLAMAAGAIISGAYFGDKMSPLSETTNLAPGVVGVDLFQHIRHMMFTTGPSLLIALVLYGILGGGQRGSGSEVDELNGFISGIEATTHFSVWLLLPPVLVLSLVMFKVPALPALVSGVVAGGVAAVALQGIGMADLLLISYDGFASSSGNTAVDDLLTRGGMNSMYGTVGIVVCALSFGGVMEQSGMLARLAEAILQVARTRGGLVASTLGTSLGINAVAADQYLSIVVPGRMFRPAFERMRLHPKNLSRCMEDGGTITSPLIPWNSCGAYMFATLGVFPLAYLPFAFLNLINPLISLIYGYTGWTMTPAEKSIADDTATESNA